jgi:[NiFe] hydrogenase assembly HybE family chaperone
LSADGETAPAGFEGSFLGATDKISARAIMECKICWTPYDPAEGDDTRAIAPGTAFVDLPEDWKCPECDAPKAQFLVREDPGRADMALAARMADAVARLEAEFREIHHAKMRDTPFTNQTLKVEAVGFRPWEGRFLGVLIAPWFMNLILLPGTEDDWSSLQPGVKELIAFPSGVYEFIHNARDGAGGYKACSLFSPMSEFDGQADARAVAEAVLPALFDPEHFEETDRSADIRAAREAAIAAEAEAAEARGDMAAPSRRAMLGAPARPEADGARDA